jgi:alanyl aminopeptidase
VTPKGSAKLAQVAVSMTPPILAALEKYFGRPYPYEKLDMIAVPEFSPGAMENPGAITYGDRFLLFDPNTMSASRRRTLAQFTAHELAHMWFGDLVTMEWWDDLWLNEAFAEWMANKIAEEIFPELQINVTALFELQNAMYLDSQLAARTIRQPVKSYTNILAAADPLTYKKGQATLGMFERWMGPETFRKGVLDYLKTHEWGNATADDLWAALSRAAGRDIRAPMSTFLDQPGIPLVQADVLSDGRVRLSQRRTLHYGTTPPAPQIWQIPITLKYHDGAAVRTHSLLLSEATATVALPGLSGRAPAWLHPNANSTGYYRWSVDTPILQKLAQVAPAELSPFERIGFLQNLGSLLDAGAIRGDDYCRLVTEFASDPRPEVARAVANAVSTVKEVFVTPELEPAFANYVRGAMGPAAKRFGLEKAAKEEEGVSLLRPTILAWLADEGRDEEALAYAEGLGRKFLADRTSVDPSLVNQAVVLSAIRGDAALFDEYKRRFETTPVPTDRETYLHGIGNFRDPALRSKALDYVLEGPLRPHEIFIIPQQVGSTIGQDKYVFEWATSHYEAVVKKIPPAYQVYLPYMGVGCEQDQIDKAKAFFSMPEHTAPGMEIELARVLEAGGDCIRLRSREGKAVGQYLAQLGAAGGKPANPAGKP